MNEQDFKDALHRTMAVQQAPPPMSDVPVLAAARRDRTRRRTVLAAAGSVAAVVAMAVGVGVIAPPGEEREAAQPPPGRHPASVELLDDLIAALVDVVPAGYEAHRAMFADYVEVGGQRTQIGVSNGSHVGRLLIQLTLPDGELREGCELAENWPGGIDVSAPRSWSTASGSA